MLTNALYIISTPIGNLGDISPRAKGILQEADVIACEDTRVSKKLFSLLGLSLQKKFITYHDHNEEEKAQEITDIIAGGKAVALISDAGSPLISDPGYKLVRKCREQNVNVTAIPGACAVITALQLSGLPTNRFMFAGFIPNKEKAREDLFNELKNIDTTLIFYETAPRLIKTLEKGAEIFGNREIAVARELTKIHEETLTGSFSDIIASFSQTEPKGEFVVMIAPPDNKENIFSSEAVADLLREKMQSVSLKSAVKEVAQISGLNKNEVYDLALRIKNDEL
ncbi:MAG: 16S rRNA (cytidine(1402)-2'-O)-methyltransferase [Alphaproteobacteria bacterium]|nr:16S rRNA (cytidine(1402)-2'-O)-methyltransferase [Alphaproteobacteria bacterium]